ncbi:MAG: ABC transporter permease [Eubacteriales bacterium]
MRDLLSVNFKRVLNIYKMDLRKMMRGKAFYVMLAISIFIPVMMLTQMPGVDSTLLLGGTGTGGADAFGGGAMGLSFLGVLSGILLCIYIGTDYSSGFIKNIAASHGNKFDYIIAKGMIALICNAVFYMAYTVALAVAGAVMGAPLQIPSGIGLILYFVELLISSVAMSALVITLNLFFRRLYGWGICFTFFFATGMLIMGIRMGLEKGGFDLIAKFLNITIAGSTSLASLTPDLFSLLTVVTVSVFWTLVYSLLANKLMNAKDIL